MIRKGHSSSIVTHRRQSRGTLTITRHALPEATIKGTGSCRRTDRSNPQSRRVADQDAMAQTRSPPVDPQTIPQRFASFRRDGVRRSLLRPAGGSWIHQLALAALCAAGDRPDLGRATHLGLVLQSAMRTVAIILIIIWALHVLVRVIPLIFASLVLLAVFWKK